MNKVTGSGVTNGHSVFFLNLKYGGQHVSSREGGKSAFDPCCNF